LRFLEIDACAIAACPRAELACGFKVIHAGEVSDAGRRPGNLDAATSYDFGCDCCQALVEPINFLTSSEPSTFAASL
jgi:hypothetical protein